MLKSQYDLIYAPSDWKKENHKHNYHLVFSEIEDKIIQNPEITTRDFRLLVRDFCDSFNDYHVKVFFYDTANSDLPFSITELEGRYFINWIDQQKLLPDFYGLSIGDELLEFDQSPISIVMQELKEKIGGRHANPTTDANLAAMKLTSRHGTFGDPVCEGPVNIKVRSNKTGKVVSYQLIWNYYKDLIAKKNQFSSSAETISTLFPTETFNGLKANFIAADPRYVYNQAYNRPGPLGAFKSFVPELGKVVWRYESKDENYPTYWNSYIYEHPNGNLIGYIRIPTYYGPQDSLKDFVKIIEHMESNTDALVVDQVHNPGGSVDYMNYLASCLITEPLPTHLHQIKLNYEFIHDVITIKEFLKMVEYNSNLSTGFLPLDYREIIFLKKFAKFVLDEWNLGKMITDPIYLYLGNRINPHAVSQYSKPIVILINEMDLSCGDFFPALFQDSVSERVKLFGARTGGAGGCVKQFNFYSFSGIAAATYTFTLAERANRQKIEDKGVTPDFEYKIRPIDVLTNYSGYVSQLNEVIHQLINKK